MFELLIVACLASQDVCTERLVPVSTADLQTCEAMSAQKSQAWAKDHDLVATRATCVSASDLDRLSVVEVADGVFVHQGLHAIPSAENAGDLANLGFVVGDEAVAVIDAGGSRAVAEKLYGAIRAQTDLPIRYMILTHMHPDHVLGAEVFKELGAEVVGHPELEQALANRAHAYLAAFGELLGPEAFLGTRLVGPDRAMSEGTLDLGGRVLEIRTHALAHSESDLSVLDQQTQTWFVGDLVFAEHAPALDGSLLGWQRVLSEMAGTPVQRIVPGHGPTSMAWPTGADATLGYLDVLAAEARAAIAAGEPMSSAVRHIGESQRHGWELFDEFNRRNATTAYQELEWE